MTTKAQIIILNLIFVLGFLACSSTEVTKQKKMETKDSIYVFDEVPPEDIHKFESPVQQSFDVYVVQIGAFSNLESAKEFAEKSRKILSKDIKVEFNQQKNLYVVWIHPPFKDKNQAELFRNELRLNEDFKDAWIVTIESKK